jgi:phasin family protein
MTPPQINPYAAFKKFTAFKAPAAFNAEAVSAFYQTNFETLVQANTVLTEAAQLVASRSTEMLTDVAAEVPVAFRSLFDGKSPTDVVASQADFMKRGIERATANARELAAIVAKAQSEALDIVSKRVAASLDTVAGAAKQAATQPATRARRS